MKFLKFSSLVKESVTHLLLIYLPFIDVEWCAILNDNIKYKKINMKKGFQFQLAHKVSSQ